MKASSCGFCICRSTFAGVAVMAMVLCLQSGCIATKYKLAKKNTPPVQPVNIAFPPSPPIQATLASLISYRGPGSWKREALWDEYVVTLENHSERSLTVYSAMLTGSDGTSYSAGSDPWALEKQSKKLEQQYKDHGEAFLRAAGPGALIVGVGAATTVSAAAAGSALIIAPAAVAAAAVTVVALPVYYGSVLGINHHNKKAVMTQFKRRQLAMPLTLAPGETRTGSLFYPMVRSPGSLSVDWSSEPGTATAVLPLEFLHALHVPFAATEHVAQLGTP